MKRIRASAVYTLVPAFLLPLGIFLGFLYLEASRSEPVTDLRATLAESLATVRDKGEENVAELPDGSPEWRRYYPETLPMKIGDVVLEASVAKTWPDRIKGLSQTPSLPEEVAKLFVFESDAYHPIWMKDMNYAIDIIWIDAEGLVVDFWERASPDSYPEIFTPKVPARYVVEVASGFIEKNNIEIGTAVELPRY